MSYDAKIEQVEAHIKTLRRWIVETKCLQKARARNAEIVPRIGIRGGRATTNEAHHIRCAEEVERCAVQAEAEAREIHGIVNMSNAHLSGGEAVRSK